MIRYTTAGESHGPKLIGVIEGIPAGLELSAEQIDADLARRQAGFGRGARQKIERDRVRIVAGVRGGVTLGSPIALEIENRDWKNWESRMRAAPPVAAGREVHRPRPGHVDLAARFKYGFDDLRNGLERASARETAMRTALGAVARRYLAEFDVDLLSHVLRLGGIDALPPPPGALGELRDRVEASAVRCADPVATERMISRITAVRAAGDTLGGVFEVLVDGLVPGIGAYVQWDRRLDGRLAQALLSIPAVKGMEIGLGFRQADRTGTEVHDPIVPARKGRVRYRRPTNNAGGLEGGVTNGERLVLRAAMKPISTTMRGIPSVDIRTKRAESSAVERSDVCALPAAGVVGEAVTALTLAAAYAEKFGGDSMEETRGTYRLYLKALRGR